MDHNMWCDSWRGILRQLGRVQLGRGVREVSSAEVKAAEDKEGLAMCMKFGSWSLPEPGSSRDAS
jgi:hypothetical protein